MSNFIGMVFATLKNEGIDTKGMSTDEAVKKYNELQKKTGGKAGADQPTPAENRRVGADKIDNSKTEKKYYEPKDVRIDRNYTKEGGSKSFIKNLGKEETQYFTEFNKFNYTRNQLKVDNKNMTYKLGEFVIGDRRNSTQNGKEFERVIDTLRENGYREI